MEVAVVVVDVNEPPYFGSGSHTFHLDENADGSTNPVVLGTISATDLEGDRLTYSITSGNDGAKFSIDETTGELSYVGGGEDYESGPPNYTLTVRASDGELSDEVEVAVVVVDVNEPPLAVNEFNGFAESGDVFFSTESEPMGGGGYTIVSEPGAAPLGVPEIGV